MEQTIEQLQEQLKKQEKLASLGLLSAGIAHEIQNPLNFVINFSKMSDKLLKDLTEIVEDNEDKLPEADREDLEDIVADLKENMAKIVEHGERAISIIQGILLVSRGKEGQFLPTDIVKLVKEYVWLSYHAMRANHKGFNISIHEQYQEGLPPIMVIPQDLSRAVLNLMNNACYAVRKKSQTAGEDYKPEVIISVEVRDEQLIITLQDNGLLCCRHRLSVTHQFRWRIADSIADAIVFRTRIVFRPRKVVESVAIEHVGALVEVVACLVLTRQNHSGFSLETRHIVV